MYPTQLPDSRTNMFRVANWLCQRGCLNARCGRVRYILQFCNGSWIRLEIGTHCSYCSIISLTHPQLIRSMPQFTGQASIYPGIFKGEMVCKGNE